MDWGGDSAEQLTAILESRGSEEEEDEDDEDEEEVAVVQEPLSLGWEVGDTEQWLLELEQASQALLAELSALETECELERTCRQHAEAYAAQVKQENRELKRLSLAPLAPPALPQEQPPQEQPPEGDPDPQHGQQLQELQKQLSWLREQRDDLTSQVRELQRRNQDLQEQLEQERGQRQQLREALATSQRALSSSKRLSQVVTQDCWEVTQQLELEQDLPLNAEAFAHEPQELDVARAALAAAEEEKLELRKRLEEAKGQLGGLREEVMLLREKVAKDSSPQSQSREVAVPVPPPLPPPAVPVDPLLALRQRRGLVNPQRNRAGGDDARARAVQEMMQRIKAGVVLRPAKERVSPRQDARRSAVLELESILGAMRTGRGRGRGQSSVQRGEQRLENVLQCRGADGAPPPSPPASQQGPDPGDKDMGTVPSPGSGDRGPFRARVTGGLPRTRPLARRAGASGEPG